MTCEGKTWCKLIILSTIVLSLLKPLRGCPAKTLAPYVKACAYTSLTLAGGKEQATINLVVEQKAPTKAQRQSSPVTS